jgi:hypothetical protein
LPSFGPSGSHRDYNYDGIPNKLGAGIGAVALSLDIGHREGAVPDHRRWRMTMKKVLMIFGAIFVILVVIAVLGVAIVAVRGNALDKESKQYADTTIRAIISQWDIREIQSRASPEFKAAVKDDDLEKLVKMFRRLGKLNTYNGAKGQANMSVTTQDGKVISALYVGTADFDTGPAEIKLSLIKHGSHWQLLGLIINSKIFLDQP